MLLKILVSLSILMLIIYSYGLGYKVGQDSIEPEVIIEKITKLPDSYYIKEYPEPISIEVALEIIAEARYSHQYWLGRDDPIPMTITDNESGFILSMGGLERQKMWVKRYDQLRDLIIKLDREHKDG